jgi:dihydroorotate dehydrogenase
MYRLFRSLLFRLDPETAHALTLQALRISGSFPASNKLLTQLYKTPSRPVQAFGLTFKNPVGLAAGYDKDALATNGLSTLGFGHVEVGTVTLKPQPGNPHPRVFRLPEDSAVINRMGFPSLGASYVERQVSKMHRPSSFVLGLNLGKNKNTPLEEAANDYIALMRLFMPHADYLTINISSPNTVGLRRLQSRELLEDLLNQINLERGMWNIKLPILVKIAPDLSDEELEDAIGVILDKNMDGIIATNTTLAREGLRSRHRDETGGLSGSPLAVKSEAVLSRAVELVNGKVPIVSAGGIMNPDDAKKRLALGASLVQIYTGLVYRGPNLVKEIVENL